jgi:hypothetical protein
VKEGYLFLADMGLSYYSAQYQFFQLAKASWKEETWSALQCLIRYISTNLKLSIPPIPILGDDYYATGSFSYFRDLAFRLKREYYFVAVDFLDISLFWPLIAHEVAHCWLNETRYLKQISASSEALSIKAKTKVPVEERVEETLCDLVATRLFGPAYPQAYNVKLWLRFPKEVHEDYPQHSFRLECMIAVLERLELNEVAEEFKKLRDEKFDVGWQQEEISPLKEQLLEVSKNIPTTINRKLYERSLFMTEQLFSSPPRDPVLLFLTCWNKFIEEGPSKIPILLSELSSLLLRTLTL